MAENRAPKRLNHCDTEKKASLKRSPTQDEEEEAEIEFPATKMQLLQQQQPARPDLEEDWDVGLTCEGSSSNFDVFISHRGPDTKHTLAYHMYDLLQAKGIRAFLDKEELQSGERFSEAIEEAIGLSTVHVCILSSGYAESVWCLKELEIMIRKYQMGESKLIPVFYDVEPFEVRYLKGAFGQGFQKLVDKDRYSREIIDQWKNSLAKIAQISGEKGKGEICRKIVHMICKLLDFGSVATSRKIVGIREQLCRVKDDIMKRRKEGLGVTSVEISGIGGIGKTTFAKELYNMIHHQYERSCFIVDVNGLVEKHGVNEVHKQLISELFSFDPSYLRMEGKKLLSDRLNGTEFLVVLDNIHSKFPLSHVFIEDDVFPSKESLIIVTSREKGVLQQDGGVARFYQNLISLQISELSFRISKKIFCQYASPRGIDNEKNEFNDLINNIVSKCHGVPLALISLGNVVRGKDIKFWRNLWNSVKDSLFQDVKMILKLSYDNLETKLEKCLFLDVATFFSRENEKLLAQLRSSDDEDGESKVFWALEILERKLLINRDSNGLLNMHDLLVDLGKSIIKDDSLCPGGSRVWHPRDVRDVLSEEMGTEKVTALSLVSNGSTVLDECGDPWSTEAFSKLPSLEFLILHGPCIQGNDFSKFSKKLLWLKWTNFPYDHIPETLCIKRVRVLQLSGERLTWLWERAPQETPAKLRELSLSNCKYLLRLPEFQERFLHFSCLILDGCTSLVTLPNSFGRLQGLKHLQLIGCNVLERLPDAFGDLRNLCKLEMWFLERLKSLPESFGNLSRLENLEIGDCNALQCLAESFGNLSQLKSLTMPRCGALQQLPKSFDNLSRLESLNMAGSWALQSLPASFDRLLQLKTMVIHLCEELRRLPESFGNLGQLQYLDCTNYKNLKSLPESSGNPSQQLFSFSGTLSLMHENLSIKYLRALQCLPESFGNLSQVNKLSIIGCIALQCLPESFGKLSRLKSLTIKECSALQCLPESFIHLQQLQTLSMEDLFDLTGLPESLGHLPQLQVLKIIGCSGLEGLPKSFACLTKLVELKVNHCRKIKLLEEQFQWLLGIPELSIMKIAYSSFGQNIDCWKNSKRHGQDTQHQHLISLVHEVTRGTQAYSEHAAPPPFSNVEQIANHFLQELPQSLSASQHIKTLHLHHCHSLQKLPDIRGSLKSLKLNSCLNLKVLPACIENLSGLEFLSLSSSWNLKEFPDTIGNLKNLEYLYVSDCIVLKGLAFQSGSFPNLVSFTVKHCWMVEVIDIHALVRLSHFEVDACVNLRSIAGLSGLPQLREIRIQGCLNLKDIVPGDINGCASWSSLNILEISGCYQLRSPPEDLVQQLPRELEELHLSLNHDIISRASLDNQTETMPASLINWSLNAKVQGLSPSRVVNAKTNPALFPVVEQRVTHLLSTKHDSFSSSTSSFSFYKFSQLRARSSSSSTSSFFFHKFSQLDDRFSSFPCNIKEGVGILCFVSVVGTVNSPMHVPPPQTVFSMNAQGGPFNIHLVHSKSFDFGEEIHMATFPLPLGFDLEHMYIQVWKGTDYWPSYEAIVKEGWIILLPGGQGEKGNAAEILNIMYSELRKQRFMSRAWTQLPSQLHIFEFSALDIAGCQITKTSRHCNTCIMEEETGLTWKRRRCLFVDDHALLLQHPRSSSRHSFLPYPGLHPNLEGGGVLANLYEMSICMLVKGKVVHSIKLQEMVGINQVEIPGDLNTLLQRNASRSTFETLHREIGGATW